MIRRFYLLAMAAVTAIGLLIPAKVIAQDVPRPAPRIPFPKIEGLPPELQKQFERMMQEQEALINRLMLEQEALQGRRDLLPGNAGLVQWGGVRLKKVTPAQQEELGLPENEGLVVAAVDAGSLADKAGLKVNDIVVKINNKSVPSDASGFAKLVKDQNATDPMELAVVRNGKEETIKGARMPVVVQTAPLGGRGGFGGAFGGGFGPRINLNPRVPDPVVPNFPNPFQPAAIQNLQLEMTVNGAKVSRKQTSEEFSGEYAKGELKITVTGKVQNGQPAPTEVTVQDGRETKKYTKLNEVPVQYRAPIQQYLLPTSSNRLPLLPGFDD